MDVERVFETGVSVMTTMVSTELVTGSPVRVLEGPRVRRRPTATRRGPIAVPVSGVRRPGGVPAPSLAGHGRTRGRTATAPVPQAWEWTDRGLAAIMVVGLMIVVAALVTIVTVTLTVTDEDYRPDAGSGQGAQYQVAEQGPGHHQDQ